MIDDHDRERINGYANLGNAITDMIADIRANVRPIQTAYLTSVGHTWESAAALEEDDKAALEAGWRTSPMNPANKESVSRANPSAITPHNRQTQRKRP